MISVYFGPVVNPKTLTQYDALHRCLIAIGLDGNILWIEHDVEASAVHDIVALRGLQDGEYNLVDFTTKPGEFIMPGLIDTHVHACQFPNLGIGGDNELLDWLLETVFPAEAKFENEDHARVAYNSVIDRSIACGTTTSCYYGSLHLGATKILADIIKDKGQRAFVGKCNMDWNCPGYYIEKTPEVSLQETIDLIKYIQAFPLSHANEPLVHPIITPRFALSCSDKLLTKLGNLAASLPDVSIQTHISENQKEVEEAVRRFDAESYAAIYDRFGLLRNNTILGHGVWLTEKEMRLIAERGAGVAHCPTSNFYLSSGMAKVGLLLDYGIKVGLGTDVGGGYNPSILYAIQMASTASKMVAVQAQLDEERHRQRRDHTHCKHRRHWEHGHEDKDWDWKAESDEGDGNGNGENFRHRSFHGGHGHHHHRHHHGQGGHEYHHHTSEDDKGPKRDSHYEGREHHHHHHGQGRHEYHYRSEGEGEDSKHFSHHERREPHHHHHHPHGQGRHEHHHFHSEGRGEDKDHHYRDHHHNHCHGETSFANKKLGTATLLYLATLGGASVCCLQDRIGSFEVGKAFDALHISLDDACGNPAVWGMSLNEVPKENEEDVEEAREQAKVRRWLERFLFTGDDRNVRKVWVQGVLVGGADK